MRFGDSLQNLRRRRTLADVFSYTGAIKATLIAAIICVALRLYLGAQTFLISPPRNMLENSMLFRKSEAYPRRPDGERMRTMLFITTHMSRDHIWHLKSCWPAALRNSLLLNTSNVFVHLNSDRSKVDNATALLRETFKSQNLTIHVVDKINDRQVGAMAALTDATKEGWFQGFDWVIRVNPDVIIRDEKFLLDAMENEPDTTGLLVNCKLDPETRPKVHTDFFAIKPEVLPPDAFLNPTGRDAENSFTNDIMDNIIMKGNHRWIPGADSPDTACRVGWNRKMVTSPIIHFHPRKKQRKTYQCPIPFQAK